MDATNFYPHTCIIQRETGIDAVGDVEFEDIYSGECGLQRSGSGTTWQGNYLQDSPLIIIPAYDIVFKQDDLVTVTDENGRVMKFTIKQYESVHDDVLFGSTIWLKDGVSGQF